MVYSQKGGFIIMKIGLMGFDFSSPNKGCEALSYSFINMLVECFGKEIEIVNFSYGSMGKISEYYPFLRFMVRHPHVKNPLDWLRLKREMSELDMIFDVTFGDGFSDIYGKMWNATTDMLKELAIQSGTSLILLPQTYGPYKDPKLKKWAEHIVKKCSFAYSRDTASAVEMNKICGNKVEVLTDMAFALPYNKSEYLVDHSKMNVGINVSSLLWDSAYAKDNKFGLKTEYKEFIMKLIQELLNCGEYRIHLIPHVIDAENYESAENDVRACDAVKKMFDSDDVICAPAFENPVDAKSYIANMDAFVGARMHATIGAVSAGVATIPFAYSKKFKTMFGNLGYKYVIEAQSVGTSESLKQTLEWIKGYRALAEEANAASITAKNKLQVLKKVVTGMNQNNYQ